MTRITLKKTWMKRMKNTRIDPLFSASGHTFSGKMIPSSARMLSVPGTMIREFSPRMLSVSSAMTGEFSDRMLSVPRCDDL